jgi:hypothetical protein
MADADYQKPTTLEEARTNPRYKGKIVVAAGGEVHGTYREERAVELYKQLRRKHPSETPVSTVIPKDSIVIINRLLS